MKYIAELGRLWKISLAEIESLLLEENTKVQVITTKNDGRVALFESETVPDIKRFGGVQKFGEWIGEFREAVDYLQELPEGKITLGISDYRKSSSGFKAQGEALKLKRILAKNGRSVRVLQNKDAVLSSATSHHNQLAEKKNHVEIMVTDGGYYRLLGVQNITEYAKRDQARPARDAKVGMLPPKLAQILINLCGELPKGAKVLDPFCGTGVVLQEAVLDGYCAIGTDIEPRMVEYSEKNLKWIESERKMKAEWTVAEGDATSADWGEVIKKAGWTGKVQGVAAEAFLGQPMSQPPAEIKLKQEMMRCRDILVGFYKNLARQVDAGTPVVVAVPAWLRPDGHYERLKLLDEVEKLGYNVVKFRNLGQEDLLYYRDGQIVAREIIVLRKK